MPGHAHHLSTQLVLAGAAAAVTVHLLLGAVAVQRAGYSPDEEITAIVVGAISDHGAPVLPSGVLYNRGFPFSYLAWAAGRVFGDELFTYRGVSLVISAAGLVAVFAAARRMAGPLHGLVAVLVLAAFPPYVAAASFARQYAALVACVVAGIALFARWLPTGNRTTTILFLAAAALASALHPLGIVVVALPALAAVMPDLSGAATGRAALCRLAILTAAVALASHLPYLLHWRSLIATGTNVTSDAAIYAIPTLPSAPAAALLSIADAATWAVTAGVFTLAAWAAGLKRASGTRWYLAACAALAAAGQVGMLIVLAGVTCLVAPRAARFRAAAGALFGTAAIFWWAVLIAWQTDAVFSPALVPAVWRLTSDYPLSAVRYTAESLPHVLSLAIAGAVLAARSMPATGAALARLTAMIAMLALAGFSALGIPLVERYLLLPWVLLALLASYGIVRAGRFAYLSPVSRITRAMPAAIAASACVVMASGHVFYGLRRVEFTGPAARTLSIAPRTGASWSPPHVRTHVRPSDVVICTEELACLYLVGRLDYQLALTSVDLDHYAVQRRGGLRGFYADSPILSTRNDLAEAVFAADGRCAAVINLNSGKIDFDEHRRVTRELLDALGGSMVVDTEELSITRFCQDQVSRKPAPADAGSVSPGLYWPPTGRSRAVFSRRAACSWSRLKDLI